jgi:hypothetical protein
VNAIGFSLFFAPLDQAYRGQNKEAPRQRREANIAEVVAHQTEHRCQAEAEPPRQTAQPITQTHGILPTGDHYKDAKPRESAAVPQVTGQG